MKIKNIRVSAIDRLNHSPPGFLSTPGFARLPTSAFFAIPPGSPTIVMALRTSRVNSS